MRRLIRRQPSLNTGNIDRLCKPAIIAADAPVAAPVALGDARAEEPRTLGAAVALARPQQPRSDRTPNDRTPNDRAGNERASVEQPQPRKRIVARQRDDDEDEPRPRRRAARSAPAAAKSDDTTNFQGYRERSDLLRD